MFKKIDKGDYSYDDISRMYYGTAAQAGNLSKINSNTDGEIIIFSDDELPADGSGINVNIDGYTYDTFYNAFLVRNIKDARCGIFIFEGTPRRFKKGQNASIYINGNNFLNGIVKNIDPVLDNETSCVQVEIKSRAGILIDSVLPFPLEFNGISIKTLFTNVCGYWGIPVEFADDIKLDLIPKTEIGNSFAAQMHESAWDFLVRIASSKGLLIRDTGNGLYVGNLEIEKSKISFIEGQCTGVTSWKPLFHADKLTRYYEAHTQFPESACAVAQIPLDLPTISRITKPDATQGSIQDFADWAACRAIGEAFKFKITADDNFNLQEGDFITFQSPRCYIDEEIQLVIEEIIQLNPVGTEFIFTLPCAYTGKIPESLPLC
jgi:hypothetical protein